MLATAMTVTRDKQHRFLIFPPGMTPLAYRLHWLVARGKLFIRLRLDRLSVVFLVCRRKTAGIPGYSG